MRGKVHEGHYVVELLPGLWTNTVFDNPERFQPDDGGEIYIIRTSDPPTRGFFVEAHVPVQDTIVTIRFPKMVGTRENDRPWDLFKRIAEKIYAEEKHRAKGTKRIIVTFKNALEVAEPVEIAYEP